MSSDIIGLIAPRKIMPKTIVLAVYGRHLSETDLDTIKRGFQNRNIEVTVFPRDFSFEEFYEKCREDGIKWAYLPYGLAPASCFSEGVKYITVWSGHALVVSPVQTLYTTIQS